MACRIASVGHSLTRCTQPWSSERAGYSSVAPAGMKSIRIVMSTVTGHSVLYPYPQLQLEPLLLHYELLIWFPGLLCHRVVEEGSRDSMLLLLYISLLIQPL